MARLGGAFFGTQGRGSPLRSEKRRVGEEGRFWGAPGHLKKKITGHLVRIGIAYIPAVLLEGLWEAALLRVSWHSLLVEPPDVAREVEVVLAVGDVLVDGLHD